MGSGEEEDGNSRPADVAEILGLKHRDYQRLAMLVIDPLEAFTFEYLLDYYTSHAVTDEYDWPSSFL